MAIAIVVCGALYGAGVGSRLSPLGLEDPQSESAQANALIERATGNEAAPGFFVLVSLGAGVKHTGTGKQALLETLAAGLKIHQVVEIIQSDPQVGDIHSALEGGSYLVSRNGLLSCITVQFRRGSERYRTSAAQRLATKLAHLHGVKVGGSALAVSEVTKIVERDTTRAVLFALPILALLSLVFFRGLVAAALPLLIGGAAISLTRASLRFSTHFVAVSAPALSVITALSLGLALDYSLLIVSRFREDLALNGGAVPDAVRSAMATAGRTVLFSALTVAAALASLLVLPEEFFYSIGLGGALATLLVCIAALTVLPALLRLLGPRIDALSPRALQRSAQRVARPVLAGRWYRFALLVMRRPVSVALAGGTLLVALGVPALGMKFNPPNVSVLPPANEIRHASSVLQSGFKFEPEGIISVVTLGASQRQLTTYRRQLGRLPNVSPILLPEQRLNRRATVVDLPTTAGVSSASAERLVRRIRRLDTPFETKVTGPSAAFVDLMMSLEARLPVMAGLVACATLLSIFLLTRSVVLPLKTLLMNALSACATLGVLVLVFQHGLLHGLLGNAPSGTLEIAQPILTITVLFGLSTDYGVFLLDRIQEVHRTGESNEKSIALGLERTGRITTTAALLLCIAVGSLATSHIVDLREFSVGLAVGVLLDATVVRALLVPSLMRLLGEWNWWGPSALQQSHRHDGGSDDTVLGDVAS